MLFKLTALIKITVRSRHLLLALIAKIKLKKKKHNYA